MQVTIRGDGVETVEPVRGSSEDVPSGAPSGGTVGNIDDVLASARSLQGLPMRPDQIAGNEDNVLVNTPGGQFTVGSLLATGELRKLPDGSIVAGSAYTAGSPLETATARPEPGAAQRPAERGALPEATEATMGELLELLPESTQMAAVNTLAEGDIEFAVRALRGAGFQAEVARELVQGIRDSFEAQARTAVARMGLVDPDAVFAWAHQHAPKALVEAAKHHAFERNTRGYGDLVTDYLIDLERTDPAMVLGATFGEGVSVGRTSTGAIYVELPSGEQVSWAQAVRDGMVRGGGRR
jgi:hypothetical protein